MLPSIGLLPAPAAQAAKPPVEPRVRVDRLTIIAPLSPGVEVPNAPGDRQAAVTPSLPAEASVSLALISSTRLDIPSAVGTSGTVPAGDMPASRPPAASALAQASSEREDKSRAADAAALLGPDGSEPTVSDDVSAPAAAVPGVERAVLHAEPSERKEPPPAVPTAARVDDEDLVRRLLDEYTGAFERLDVSATKAVWPSVDDRKLRRAYERLSAQRLSLESCGIKIFGRTANARCQGSATYQPKIGTRPVQIASREWMFDLSKQDAAWHIVNTVIR